MVSSVALCVGGLHNSSWLLAGLFISFQLFQFMAISIYYTYILESINKPGERYIGHTYDLQKRLKEHNTGKCKHTNGLKPWELKLYIAFETLIQARKFECYLKSGSGHAFAKKRFWKN
jgi:predicted GIY-YIG superfamily endonuclease